ncbi:MAG: hypothetical protein ACYC4L_15775 [Chloroflexota bacterium]
MEAVFIVAILALGIFAAYTFWKRPSGVAETRVRLETTSQQGPSLGDLRPGDALTLWDEGEKVVRGVLRCREEVNGRVTNWQWALLDGGAVIESSPEGQRLYQEPTVIYQGSAEFEQLVPPSGALGVFEERVRAGESGRNPVLFEQGGRAFKVGSTGTFAATTLGDLSAHEVWRDVSSDPSQNVYFELLPVASPAPEGNGHGRHRAETPAGEQLLGIWTTHVWLGKGRRLQESDVSGLYGAR